jgi:hypothetical protein
MKKTLLLFNVLLVFGFISAQTEKGNFLLGGNLANLQFGLVNNNNTSISINPNAGYFVSNRVAMGISMPISFDKNNFDSEDGKYSNKTSNFGIGYFWRFYLSDGYPFKFFSGFDFGIKTFKNNYDFTPINGGTINESNRGQDFYFIFDAGAVYFLNKTVGIESILSTSNLTNEGMTLNFRIGFQIYLNTNK